VTLAIVDAAAFTSTGQVRRSNEDSYLLRAPLFVVADGMGGARAGETASRICIETFDAVDLAGGAAVDVLRRTIETSNARIFAHSTSDPTTAGMGTTVTAAVLEGDSLALGHVGDSRAYLLRGGALQQVTDDHSLVGELVRRGALTPAEAAVHPQRSVITRVLGTEGTVQVDTATIEVREDDVVLLCSDGLSGMVADPQIERILATVTPLASAVRELVRAANAAGGEDNITAVALRIGTGAGRAIAPSSSLQADRPELVFVDADTEPHGPPRSLLRRIVIGLVTIVAVGLLVLGTLTFMRWAHFVGATPDGRLAVYQGVPFEITSNLHLYRSVRVSSLPAAVLSQGERTALLDHALLSLDDAQARIDALPANGYWGAGRS
jgi:protein phosphatase